MKLLQISNYYYPHTGGIEQVARDIVKSLSDQDIEQKVICFNEDAKRDDLVCKGKETVTDMVDGVEIYRCGCFAKISSQSLSLSYPRQLKNLLDHYDPDVLIFHYPNPYVASFLLPMLKSKTRLIVFWNLDITKQKILGKLFYNQTIRLLERAERVIPASPNYIEGSPFLRKYKDKCTVISNCVSIDFNHISEETLKQAKDLRNQYGSKFVCFAIGRHVPYKGFEYLIEASRYLDDDYAILIGGKGPLTEKLKEKAKDDPKVHFLGFISDDKLTSYYLASDIIAFPSITKNEAFGISLAEGMSFGKPAVTFTIPGSGVNYVNLNGVSGIEVENRNGKAYAEAIETLNHDKELYIKYSKNAKTRVVDLFTFEKFKENIVKLILG